MKQDEKGYAAFELLMSRRFNDALAAYNQLIAGEPNEPRHYMYRSQCLYQMKDLNAAIEDGRKAISLAEMPWMKEQLEDYLSDLENEAKKS